MKLNRALYQEEVPAAPCTGSRERCEIALRLEKGTRVGKMMMMDE